MAADTVTVITGAKGQFEGVAGFNAKIHTWSATFSPNPVETTGFADNGYERSKSTVIRINGKADGHVAEEDSPVAALALAAELFSIENCKGTFTLTADTGCSYTGSGAMGTVTVSRSALANTTASVSMTFRSIGAWEQTWVGSGA